MNRAFFADLYTHMEWADCQVWAEVLRRPTLADDPFVRESLFHIHLVQLAYLSGWRGDPPRPDLDDDFASVVELRAWGRSFYPGARAFLDGLSDEDLDRRDPVLWPDLVERAIGRPPVPIPLSDMVYQVAAHSSHHRAQVNRRIRELEGDPPFIDYVAWAWMGKPVAEWAE